MGTHWMCWRRSFEVALVALALPAGATVADEPAKLRLLVPREARPVTPIARDTTEELPAVTEPETAPGSEAWAMKPIGAVTLNIGVPAGDMPDNTPAPYLATAEAYTDQSNLESVGWSYAYYWQASAFCHGPLYFEEVNLERYGYSAGVLQPALSAAHFFGTLPALPYKMTVNPPGTCIYTLGQARPGSYTPFRWHREPLRLDAAFVQGAVVTGLVFLIP